MILEQNLCYFFILRCIVLEGINSPAVIVTFLETLNESFYTEFLKAIMPQWAKKGEIKVGVDLKRRV